MSKIALVSNASGTGTLSIAAPNTNSDRTLTLPDSTGTIATAESTLTQFNASGSAPVFAARAWVNFNGTGTPAIRASGNVSSITDMNTGRYEVNFTTAMPDANYAVNALPGQTSDDWGPTASGQAETVSKCSIGVQIRESQNGQNQWADRTTISVSIFR